MSELFGPLLTTPEMEAAVSDAAWLRALLRFESELAAAEAAVGAIPGPAAAAIAEACAGEVVTAGDLGRAAVAAANPVVPLVRALTAATAETGRPYVHWGATSQDVLDTAAMLVARDALGVLLGELDGLAGACAALAERHRGTLMPGRTLLQQAVPTTFGLKAAGWMTAADAAQVRLQEVRGQGLAVQLGGAAGTLAALEGHGLAVRAELARRLGLADPPLAWHGDRTRIAGLAGALAVAAGVAGKVGLDVVLLAQTEVGEAAEAAPGASSTMPQKRNPVAAIEARAAAQAALGPVLVLLGAQAGEQERAAGAWQAEWQALADAFRWTAGAVARARTAVAGLQVDEARMRANLDVTGGRLLAEAVQTVLATRLGRARAHELVEEAARADDFRAALAGALPADELERALDPARYLGEAEAQVDRALAAHRSMRRDADG